MTLKQINQYIRIGWYAVILIVILAVTCSCGYYYPQEKEIVTSAKKNGDVYFEVTTNSYVLLTKTNYKVGDTLYIDNKK